MHTIRKILITLGVLVVVVPLLGFPIAFERWALILFGVGIVVAAWRLSYTAPDVTHREGRQVYVENGKEQGHEEA